MNCGELPISDISDVIAEIKIIIIIFSNLNSAITAWAIGQSFMKNMLNVWIKSVIFATILYDLSVKVSINTYTVLRLERFSPSLNFE